MVDIEKVIKGLEMCAGTNEVAWETQSTCDLDCPYAGTGCVDRLMFDALALLKEQIPDSSKYQYKYDHTDCIWYHDSRSKCPVTCSQYRDGWNDAMKYIFKDGKGYSPYKRR